MSAFGRDISMAEFFFLKRTKSSKPVEKYSLSPFEVMEL